MIYLALSGIFQYHSAIRDNEKKKKGQYVTKRNTNQIDHSSHTSSKKTCAKLRYRKRQKPMEWFDDHQHAVRGETSLWVAVITQAMMDALSRSNSSEAKYHKFEAINWLTGNSKNFIAVCLHAGLDPDYVRRKAKRACIPSPMACGARQRKTLPRAPRIPEEDLSHFRYIE